MSPRISCVIVALALTAVLGGCAPEPRSSPSASPSQSLSSEAEAFAAAEKTYRAYVDALNQVDLSDPETFEPVFALTTGDARDASEQTFSQMHADGWAVEGKTRIDSLEPAGEELGEVALDICLNVADVLLTDPSGDSVVSSDRLDVQAMRVVFHQSSSGTPYLISSITGREGGTPCAG